MYQNNDFLDYNLWSLFPYTSIITEMRHFSLSVSNYGQILICLVFKYGYLNIQYRKYMYFFIVYRNHRMLRENGNICIGNLYEESIDIFMKHSAS